MELLCDFIELSLQECLELLLVRDVFMVQGKRFGQSLLHRRIEPFGAAKNENLEAPITLQNLRNFADLAENHSPIVPRCGSWQEVWLEGIAADEIPDVVHVTVVAGVTYTRQDKGEKAGM